MALELLSALGSPSQARAVLLIAAISVPITLVLKWAVAYTQLRRKVKHYSLPSIHSAVEVFESYIRCFYPHVPVLVPMKTFSFDQPFKKYADNKSDLILLTQASTPNRPTFITGSPQIAKTISLRTDTFHKPVEMPRYRLGKLFGQQIVSAQNGAEHDRHRRVVRGCFNEGLMESGWHSMQRMWSTMVREEGLLKEGGGILHDAGYVMVKVTLGVIGGSWFGIDIPWKVHETDQGYLMPFAEALHVVTATVPAQVTLPQWFMEYNPLPYLRRLGRAQRSLVHHFRTARNEAERKRSIEAQEKGFSDGPETVLPQNRKYKNIIRALIDAQNDVEKGTGGEAPQVGLADSEILGNIWIFILAGHETTGHNLGFALALLAAHPEWQEKLYAEVLKVVHSDGGTPEKPRPLTYKDVPRLPTVLAAAYEALRMRDLVMQLNKVCVKDTTLSYTTWEEQDGKTVVREQTAHIPAGARVAIDTAACGVNPFFWNNPETYDPSRHLRTDENGETAVTFRNHVGFSLGARQCLGKRFAEIEMICFLSHMVLNFRWETVALPGETQKAAEERAARGLELLTLTPDKYDLRMIRR